MRWGYQARRYRIAGSAMEAVVQIDTDFSSLPKKLFVVGVVVDGRTHLWRVALILADGPHFSSGLDAI
jgi:hypothetical protein